MLIYPSGGEERWWLCSGDRLWLGHSRSASKVNYGGVADMNLF